MNAHASHAHNATSAARPAGPALPELDRLAGEVGGLLNRIGLDPAPARSRGLPDGPRSDRIDTRFAEAAARHAARTAASDTDGEVTYLELEWLADEIARRFEGRTGPGLPVALRVSRSRFVPAAVVGVLRSGAVCLPVDPDASTARQEYLLRESGAGLVLTDSGLLGDETPLSKAGPFVIATRSGSPTAAAAAAGGDMPLLPDDTAYLLPTPGSTGEPRGRVVRHAEVLALMDATVPLLGTGPDDVWALSHPLSLDAGGWELWGSLLYGGHVVVVDRAAATDPLEFARLLARREVTVLNQDPAAFGSLVERAVAERVLLPALRKIVSGGKALGSADVQRWCEAGIAPDAELVTL